MSGGEEGRIKAEWVKCLNCGRRFMILDAQIPTNCLYCGKNLRISPKKAETH
jgi:DNA-directed RNA polymerase subunit RPC12/RpoP